MTYVFPPQFDRDRARLFGALIEAAYRQLSTFQSQQPTVYPEGWDVVLSQFVAYELGGGDGVGDMIEDAKIMVRGQGGVLDRIEDLLKKRQNDTLPFGFILRKGSELVVVLRGTNTPMEWVADARASPVDYANGWGKTTKGFLGLYKQLLPQILDAIRPLVQEQEIKELFVTGHSLGGALATLVSAGIYREFHDSGLKPITYTISSPRVVDPGFVQAHDEAGLITWRIFNTEDLVPTLPPAALDIGNSNPNLLNKFLGNGYQHVGYPIGVTTWHRDLVSNHAVPSICAVL